MFTLKNVEQYVKNRIGVDRCCNSESFIAATLKNQRNKLKMTLEETTSGICSKSYMSKIENNQLVGDEEILGLLFERVNINYNDLKETEVNDYSGSVLKNFIFGNFEEIKNIYEKTQNTYFFVNDSFVKAMYHLIIQKDTSAFELEIIALDNVKDSFNNYQTNYLFIILIEYYLSTNNYNYAYEYLNQVNKLKINDIYQKWYLISSRFIICANLNMKNECYLAYEKLKEEFNSGFPIKKQIKLRLLFMEMFPDDNTIDDLDNLNNDYLPNEYEDDFIYTKFIIFIKLKMYKNAIEWFNEKCSFEPKYVALFGYVVFNMLKNNKNDDYRHEFLDSIRSINRINNSKIHYIFIRLIQMKLNQVSSEEIVEFLREKVIKNNLMYKNRFYSVYFAKTYLENLTNHSRYKEALNFALNNLNLIN